MESELLTIFDEQFTPIGTATREEVHLKGYWHETFQCWLVNKENERYKLFFQKRSPQKLDHPGLLDITAAGHLLATETKEDGIRELEEEIGLSVPFQLLISLGLVKYSMHHGNKMDNELAHVYLHHFTGSMTDFKLQKEEVCGMVKIDLLDFYHFWVNESTEYIALEGFQLLDNKVEELHASVDRNAFVEHDADYYKTVLERIIDVLS